MTESQNNDTFLSRVFGLHSVYNQLQDNYQYYDEDIDASQSVNLRDLSSVARDSNAAKTTLNNANANANANNLLDSESDADEASGESVRESVNWTVPQPNLNSEPPTSKSIKFNLPQDSVFNNGSNNHLPLFHKKTKSHANTFKMRSRSKFLIPPKERALYLWANITNMDEFLNDIYYYYRGKGLKNIVLSRFIDALVLVFILWFSVFLKWGIDYSAFQAWNSNSDARLTLSDLVIKHYLWTNVPFFVKFLLFGFSCYLVLRLVQLVFDYKYKLKEIQNFYAQLIDIKNDDELMTISWIKIIEKLILLKDYNSLTSSHKMNDLNSKVRLNAHDIANRIMRKENYFVALINKNILDLSLKLGPLELSNSSVLTRTLEWNLKLCINNFIFNSNGQVNSDVLKDFNRNQLSQELDKRFKMAAIINLILSPFIVVYFVLLYFFKYFNEYRLNPSSIISLRQFTPYAEWKLREFNELPHFFNKRLKLAVGPSNTYINQFPANFLVVNFMYLINFLAGSITAVLVISGLLLDDEDHSFWSFELTENRSALFYISIFGTLWAITSNSNSNDYINNSNLQGNNSNTFYYDPEASLRYVAQFTHYLPSDWNGKLHTQFVKNQYCQLFNLRIIIILNEILSLILTPFLLWFKISNMSSSIIDFFRDYSIHIDGLGYICYFSMFNFEEKDKNMMVDKGKKSKRRKSRESDVDDDDEEEFSQYQDDKMIKSYMYFLESYQTKSDNPNQQLRNTKPSKPVMTIPRARNPLQSTYSVPSNSLYQDDSAYNFSYKLNDSEDDMGGRMGKSGVLGMLNQFYKQDLNKN